MTDCTRSPGRLDARTLAPGRVALHHAAQAVAAACHTRLPPVDAERCVELGLCLARRRPTP